MKYLSMLFLVFALIFTMSCANPMGSTTSSGNQSGESGLKIFTNAGSNPINNPATIVTPGTGRRNPADSVTDGNSGLRAPDKIYYESSKAVMLYAIPGNGHIDFKTSITFNNNNSADYFTFMYNSDVQIPVENLYNQEANSYGYSNSYNMLVVDYEDSFVVFDSYPGYEWVANDIETIDPETKIIFIDNSIFDEVIGIYSTEMYKYIPGKTYNDTKINQLFPSDPENNFVWDIVYNNLFHGEHGDDIDLAIENMLIVPVDFNYIFPGNINDVYIELKMDYDAFNAWIIDKQEATYYEYFVEPTATKRNAGQLVRNFRKAPLGEFIHEVSYALPRTTLTTITPEITFNLSY